jgi:hypothetical protein
MHISAQVIWQTESGGRGGRVVRISKRSF